MRRRFTTIALLFALSVPASLARAQGQIGAILGATFSTLRGIDGLSSRTGLVGGLSIVLPTDGFFAFQPEALLVNKGAKASTGDPEGLKLSYFEIPLLYRLKLSREPGLRPHIYLGPYLGIEIDCSVRGTSTKCDDIPGVSTQDGRRGWRSPAEAWTTTSAPSSSPAVPATASASPASPTSRSTP